MTFDWTTTGPVALGTLVVGIFLGGLLGGGGPDLKKLERHLGERIAEAGAQVAALADRVAALEAGVAGVTPAVTAAVEAIRADVDASLATREEAQAMQLSALEDRLAAVSTAPVAAAPLAETPLAETPLTEAPLAEAPAEAPVEALAEAAPAAAPTGLAPGQTAMLLEGKVRAFVGRVTDEGASVAVNGQDLVAVVVGEGIAVAVDGTPCIVALEAVDQGTALLAADCAEGAAPAAGAAASTIALAPAEAIGVGQTALFADGKLRVFLSRLDEASAVVAIGPRETLRIALGETGEGPVEGTVCAVSLLAIADGKAELAGGCAN